MKRAGIFSGILIIALFWFQACSPAMLDIGSLIEYINKVKEDIRNTPGEKKKQEIFEKARKKLLTIIDTEYVARLTLGDYYETLTKEDKKEFVSIFHELMAYNIVKTYVPIATLVQEDITVEMISDEIKTDPLFNVEANIIHTRFVNQKVWYLIDFYLHQVGKSFKLYDVHLDGASVLMDYRNQFQEIIRTRGFPYLLDRLKAKFREIEAG